MNINTKPNKFLSSEFQKKKTENKYKIHYFLAQTKPALNFLMVKCLDSKIHEFPSCFTKGEKKKKKKNL